MNKYSVAISVMSRPDRIIRCISSWLEWKNCQEVVLVDWSSEVRVDEFLADNKFENKKLKIIRRDCKKYFSLAKSFNLAVKHCASDIIIKADIDYVLKDESMLDDIIKQMQEPSSNLRPQFAKSVKSNHHNGFCIFKKKDFLKVRGYNEAFEGWGNDDNDLYSRLEKSCVDGMSIFNAKDFIFHIPHGYNLSVANYKCKDKAESRAKNLNIERKQANEN